MRPWLRPRHAGRQSDIRSRAANKGCKLAPYPVFQALPLGTRILQVCADVSRYTSRAFEAASERRKDLQIRRVVPTNSLFRLRGMCLAVSLTCNTRHGLSA